tara:strand:+ start:5762 stop:6955 length:1194 start_codon:yes stop_codon:yes gene_type:complete
MVNNKNKIKVNRIPHKGAQLSKPQVFPRMPRLYLELIENKEKIKQDLINKEHIPSVEVYENLEDIESNTSSRKEFSNRLDKLLDVSDDESEYKDSIHKSSQKSIGASSVSELTINEDVSEHENNIESEKISGDDLSFRLKTLLNNDDESASEISFGSIAKPDKKIKNKYNKHRDQSGHSVQNKVFNSPPTLAELEKGGGYVPKKELRNINQTSVVDEQIEEDKKREILFKFDLLRKSYPLSSIPEFSIHTDLNLLEKSYADSVRRLSLDSSVESYKTYLVYGFMGCEFVFGNFLGFDMQGFTQQQIISMGSYEKLLIELGEKSYVPDGSKWPVELRLLFMIIMNAAFFVISKMMMKKTGANLMGMLNSMNKMNGPTTNSAAGKRKMKGPDVDLDDIP